MPFLINFDICCLRAIANFVVVVSVVVAAFIVALVVAVVAGATTVSV